MRVRQAADMSGAHGVGATHVQSLLGGDRSETISIAAEIETPGVCSVPETRAICKVLGQMMLVCQS